jgi:hypothetical protein
VRVRMSSYNGQIGMIELGGYTGGVSFAYRLELSCIGPQDGMDSYSWAKLSSHLAAIEAIEDSQP